MKANSPSTLEQVLPQIQNMAKLFANGDQHEADDITSEAVLYILDRGFENETPSFILQQVKWQAFAHVDRASVYSKYVGSVEDACKQARSEDADDSAGDSNWTELLADEAPNPEDVLADMEFANELAAAVQQLDPKAQAIVRMLHNGSNFAEIAKAMGVSRSAISQKMTTIQNALAELL